MARRASIGLFILAILGILFWAVWQWKTAPSHVDFAAIEARITELENQVAEQKRLSKDAIEQYDPASVVGIDDLDVPLADLLRQIPGVVDVEVAVPADRPASRIIHLRDWHLVSEENLAADLEAQGRDLSSEELERLHRELLLEVDLVQIEQMAVLRCLIKRHGLTAVYAEGVSPSNLAAYEEKIALLKAMENEQIPKLERQLADLRELSVTSPGEDKATIEAMEAKILTLLAEHNRRLVEVGAPGRLLVSGELREVLPLEDQEAFLKAKPIRPDGAFVLDEAAIESRHDAQVQAALGQDKVSVIVLGGAHDLSDSVRRYCDGECEYLRVTTSSYREFSP